MEKIDIESFKILPFTELRKLPTSFDLGSKSSKVEKELLNTRRTLGDLQNKLYAHSKYSVLVCIQGMDTSGKDSLIREVFKDFNVRGVNCYSFKKPTLLELKQDFLWRHYKRLPARGKYAVFNRSHYENVLISRVHPKIILGENLPHIQNIDQITEKFWDKRLNQINQFEEIIHENGTIIFKFFLNISKSEQKRRLLRRLNKPHKNWKFAPEDIEERQLWPKYIRAYEKAINATSKPHAPWYNIPADDKPTARYLVAKILKERMESFTDIQYPKSQLENHIDFYINKLNEEE
ncbi:PPK2 family polyphosphate kinase [Mesohalobacter halotolerans]|uniref:Polyphosphate kinase 2 family protein n=1 Tax=Mesohalobacter halotolerans TaxID=1883405 RepID=A0A4U5TTA7_9FLAO|nr:PPK2 family polyphosphate kinase [Mesohalobacter halotolerans]MBS3738488.1 polyphosphate kinase 2 family protein [Psychroflexus sp.]TKS57599.1 polyphosphate kinase 2 family protein [Mesohalobacter halotolerans]